MNGPGMAEIRAAGSAVYSRGDLQCVAWPVINPSAYANKQRVAFVSTSLS